MQLKYQLLLTAFTPLLCLSSSQQDVSTQHESKRTTVPVHDTKK